MNLVKQNPELQKNFWLELSSQRLIMMPVIIFTLLFLVYLTNQSTEDIARICHIGIFLILVLWGSKVVFDNILNEYNERTWDWQRTSALTPSQLLVGKLFGAPVYNWYGGLICLGLWMTFSFSIPNNSFIPVLNEGISVLVLAIGVFCTIMMVALLKIRKGSGRNKIKGGGLLLIVLIVVYWFSKWEVMNWISGYNNQYKAFSNNTLFKYTFYSAWALIGFHQALRHELNYKNKSWLWYGFLFSSSAYQAYLFYSDGQQKHFLLLFFLFLSVHALVLSYFLIVFEGKEITQLKFLFNKLKEKDFDYINYNAPLWFLTLPLFPIALLISFVFLMNVEPIYTHKDFYYNQGLEHTFLTELITSKLSSVEIFSICLAIIFFVFRDFILMLLLVFNNRSKRVDAAFLLYLFLLYFIFPLFSIKMDELRPVFWPTLENGAFVTFILPFIEATILFYFLKTQKLWKQDLREFKS